MTARDSPNVGHWSTLVSIHENEIDVTQFYHKKKSVTKTQAARRVFQFSFSKVEI